MIATGLRRCIINIFVSSGVKSTDTCPLVTPKPKDKWHLSGHNLAATCFSILSKHLLCFPPPTQSIAVDISTTSIPRCGGKVSQFVVLDQASFLFFSVDSQKGHPLSESTRVTVKKAPVLREVFIPPSLSLCPSDLHCHGSPSRFALNGLFWVHWQIWQPDSYMLCVSVHM